MSTPINNFTEVDPHCPRGEYWKNFELIERRLRSLEEDREVLTQQRQDSVMISRETYVNLILTMRSAWLVCTCPVRCAQLEATISLLESEVEG